MVRMREPPSVVKNVMTKQVISIDVNSPVREAAKIMSKKRIGAIVVTENEKPVGIATERDILERVVAKALDPNEVRMREVMSKPLITVNSTIPIINAVRVMQRNRVRRLLVMEGDKLVGIVTQRDLLRALAFHVLISFRPLI